MVQNYFVTMQCKVLIFLLVVVLSSLCPCLLAQTDFESNNNLIRRPNRGNRTGVLVRRRKQGKLKLESHATSGRESRFLSIFSVIQFGNDECKSISGDNGTCLPTNDCFLRGGTPNGPCANGYGVCCLFMATCGGTIYQNGTYFVNMGYPKMMDSTGSCQVTLMKMHPDICQFRLDFDQFNIMGPELNNNICNNDQFIVSGGSAVPPICGVNTGNHMYIGTGMGPTNPVTITIVTSGPTFARNWKIKVTQIPCFSSLRAEEGCLQYFTGVSGMIKSFNYDPNMGLQLSNQDYSICVRIERNFCGIQYTACDDPGSINNRSRSFSLTGNTNNLTPAVVGGGQLGAGGCTSDWLAIPCAINSGRTPATNIGCVDRICGGTFSAEPISVPSTVMSSVKPFRLNFHTDGIEAPNDFNNRGFCLNYVQQPCTNILT